MTQPPREKPTLNYQPPKDRTALTVLAVIGAIFLGIVLGPVAAFTFLFFTNTSPKVFLLFGLIGSAVITTLIILSFTKQKRILGIFFAAFLLSFSGTVLLLGLGSAMIIGL